jgi:hypothetical protein
MDGTKAVVGVFSFMDDLIHAIEEVKKQNLDYRVYAPTPRHEIEQVTSNSRSSIRIFTTIGAVSGLIFGFWLPIWCSMDYPLRVSAKDIISIPGFVVIGYECTILFGAIATLIGLLHYCRIPDILRKVGYDPRFSDDKFGLVVGCEKGKIDDVRAVLQARGAEEVEVRDGI